MEFYNFQGSKKDDDSSEDVISKLKESVDSLEKKVLYNKQINADSDHIQKLLNTFGDVLEDGFDRTDLSEPESSHYWFTVSSVIDSKPMRFVEALDKFDTNSEKACVWILIELHNKNLLSVFNEILRSPQIMQFYSSSATVKADPQKVRDILSRLGRLSYNIESKFLAAYEKNKDTFEQDDSDEETTFTRSNNQLASSAYNSKAHNKNTTQPTTDLTQSDSSLKRSKTNMDAVKQNLERYKTLVKKSTIHGRDDDEFHTFVRDNYKPEIDNIDGEGKRNPFALISRVLEPVAAFKNVLPKPRFMRKTSSYEDVTKADQPASKAYLGDDLQPASYKPRRSSYDGGYKNSTYGGNTYGQDYNKRKSRIEKGFDNDDYNTGINAYRASEIRSMKNSRILFIEKYQSLMTQFEYRSPPTQTLTADQQGNKCWECGAGLNKLFLTIWPRKSYCQYTGHWYCGKCMAKEKLAIPWFVENSFEFKGQHLSRKARDELKRCYDKPCIMIDHSSKIVQEHKVLYDALVMKRQLHLMYDMICEAPYVLDLLGTNANLLLKQNLFSMKNLSEIKDGAMQRYMEFNYDILKKHVAGCPICQAKGKICPGCNNKVKIFPYDIRNTSVCRTCRYLYHARCLQLKKCMVCQHNG